MGRRKNKRKNRTIHTYVDVLVEFETPFVCWTPGGHESGSDIRFFRSSEETVVIPHHRLFALLTKAKWDNDSRIDVTDIDFGTEVLGCTKVIPYRDGTAEVFPEGSRIWISFGIPERVNLGDFEDLVISSGKVGMSPYGDEGFKGLFEVKAMASAHLDDIGSPPFKSTRR